MYAALELTHPPTWSSPRSILGVRPQELDESQSPSSPGRCKNRLPPRLNHPYSPCKCLVTSIKRGILVHISPSWPGCWPILSIFLISSNVTPSLLNRPPWTTKYRFAPSGPIITALSRGDGTGGLVAVIKVASGTEEHDHTMSKTPNNGADLHELDLLAVNTWANSWRKYMTVSGGILIGRRKLVNLVGLFSMLVFSFSFKTISPVHILRLVISAINIHRRRV